tara:strand:- start:129 stop:2702 length:2574 start_codon:yes stop_codon:yes gene_type:complete
MAQHDGVIDNGTGNAVRTDINNALAAINSNNSGGSDPSTMYPYQFYADSGDNTFKIRNAANNAYVNISVVGGIGLENFGLAPLTGATFTGDVVLSNQSDLRLREATANGTNFIALQAPAAITSDVTLTLPAVAPTANQVLTADASTPTTLNWATPSAGVGGDTGIDFNDDVKIRFGTGNDLEIFHNGTHSFIKDVGTGVLSLQSNGSGIMLEGAVAGEYLAKFNTDAAVELYYDNSKKFETLSTGVKASGHVFLDDSDKFIAGTGSDLQIYHDGTNSIIDNNTGVLSIQGDDVRIQNSAGSETGIRFVADSGVDLYHDADRKLSITSTGARVESATGDTYLDVYAEEDASGVDAIVRIRTESTSSNCYLMFGDSDDTYVGGLRYEHSGDKLEFIANNAERGSVDSNGLWRFSNGFLLLDSIKGLFGSGSDLEIYHDGNSVIDSDSGYLKLTANSGDVYIQSDSDVHITSHNAGETMAKFTKDGAAELYYDNSKKLETTSGGVTISGDLNTNGNDVYTNNGAFITNDSDGAFADRTGTNIDHIWHDDSDNAWNFVSDSTYKGTANSKVKAGFFYGDGSNLTGIAAGGVGGNTGIDFNDDIAIRFGGSNDGVIQYVSSTDAFTISTADGADIKLDSDDDLVLECDDDMTLISGDGIALKHGTSSSSENMIVCNDDASVNLYHNGSLRLNTSGSGVTIAGSIEGVGVGTAVAVLREVQPHDTDAGTFSKNADRVRVLNTEQHDGEVFCSLDTSTGEFTLPAGTYLMYFQAVAFDVGRHRAKIVTDGGTDKLFGDNVISNTAYPNQQSSGGFGVVTNASTEGYFLKHRCTTTRSTNGFGRFMDFASEEEFYSQVIIWRMTS